MEEENIVEKKKEEVVPGFVQVSEQEMKSFMARLATLESDNKKLLAAADKSRLANIAAVEAEGAPLIRTVRLSTWGKGGPLIVAWQMTSNESYMRGKQAVESQAFKVVFEDGETNDVPAIEFYRMQNRDTVAEIIGRSKNEKTGVEMLEVQTRDGKQLTIPVAFVN